MKRVTLFVVVCLLAMVVATQAQVLRGSIIGTVKDESGAILPGVSVTITSPALPAGPVTVVTNEKGEYRFVELERGRYDLTAALQGFSTYQEEGLVVTVGRTVERLVTLKLASVAETITVSGESPMVDPRRVGVATSVQQESLETLPTHRYYFNEYGKFIPGVAASNPSGDGGSISVMGSRDSENAFVFEGVLGNSSGGSAFFSGDHDALEEIQVTTLGASAEYQMAQGAVFTIVYKSGTNSLRGTARPSSIPTLC